MPYLKIQIDKDKLPQNLDSVLKEASALVAQQLGKPESYVMVALEQGAALSFAGSREGAAFMELKSIGLPEDKTPALSAALCAFAEQKLGVPGNRVYIEFSGARGSQWGWNGATF